MFSFSMASLDPLACSRRESRASDALVRTSKAALTADRLASPSAHLPRPPHGFPILLPNFAFTDAYLPRQVARGFPLAGLLRDHELVERQQAAGPAQQHRLALLIYRHV